MQNNRMAPFFRLPAVSGICALLLAGLLACSCLGQSPAPAILRLDVPALADCREAAAQRVIMLKDITTPENLDRPAVLVADGLVLRPSQQWYWEAAPGDMLAQALLTALPCVDGVKVESPYHPRDPHEGVLSGQVRFFEVQTQGAMRLRVGLQLNYVPQADRSAGQSIFLTSERPMREFSATAAAQAASEAVADINAQAKTFVSKAVSVRHLPASKTR